MIKFFRKIRYNLMEQNKTGKYFKYAIGEVILVVIGILIALQINNWNENRKYNKNNTLMLQQLLEENKVNYLKLKDDKDYRDSLGTKLNRLVTFIKEKDIVKNENKLKFHLLPLFQSTSYTFSENYLKRYINSNEQEHSILTRELIQLLTNQNDLTYISEKSLESRFENFYDVLVKDLDFQTFEIKSFELLKSFEFRNKIIMLSIIEKEVENQFNQTIKQQRKIDSIITAFLSKN